METELPCCENTDDVHEEARPHHVRGLHAAGGVHDGVRGRGYRQHEGVTHTNLHKQDWLFIMKRKMM